MYNSICIKILKEFSESDFKSFRRYVTRTLGSTNPRVKILLNELSKDYPTFEGKRIHREVLFAKVFPKEKVFEEKNIRHVMSALKKLVEQFLLEKELKENEFRKQYLLGRAYRKLGLHNLQQSCLTKTLDILEKDTRRDSRFYFKKYQIYEDLFRNNSEIVRSDKIELVGTILKNLDSLFFIEKLKYACEFVNEQTLRNITYNINLFDDILKHIEVSLLEEIPVLHIYYTAFKTLIEPQNENHFIKLKELLSSHTEYFNKYELNEIYIYARNYCVRQINRQNQTYIKELFDLNLFLLENKNLFSGTYLSQSDYRNMITLGNRLKKFEWVENFLEEYKEKLNPTERENAYLINKATLEFEQKNYDNTIELLNLYEYKNKDYEYEAKVLLAQSYFELNQIAALINLLDSFKISIIRNKNLPKARLNAYKAFCKIVPKIADFRYNCSKEKIEKLEEEMTRHPIISSQNWILEKINTFKKVKF